MKNINMEWLLLFQAVQTTVHIIFFKKSSLQLQKQVLSSLTWVNCRNSLLQDDGQKHKFKIIWEIHRKFIKDTTHKYADTVSVLINLKL